MALVTHELIFSLIARYGYALVFVLGCLEALPLVGVIVPGHATLILAGVASAEGLLDIRWVILAALAAGIFGDAVGFWIARRYGRDFLDRHGAKLRIRPAHLRAVEGVFEKHGPWALVLVRFSFIARGLGPLLAGITRMRWRTFWLYNVIGAVLWSVGNALGGYVFGLAFIAAEGYIGRILAYTALGVVGVFVLYRVLRRYAPGFTRGDRAIAITGIVTATLFGILTQHVSKVGVDNALDRHAGALIAFFAPVAGAARLLDAASRAPIAAVAALLVVALLLARRRFWQAALVGMGILGVIALATLVRLAFGELVRGAGERGFPSLHAAIWLVAAGLTAYVAWTRWRSPAVSLGLGAVGLFLAGVASSARIGAGTESPTGALAGVLLGSVWLSVSLLLVEFALKRRAPAAIEKSL